ncbi:mRNA-degrading endonuclease HigB of HigAB toxin-antitoxin module [Bradyrhizobium diazoefficiens]
MRFVGQTEVATFLAGSPAYDNTVRAWVAEMKSGAWQSAAALAAEYQKVDVTQLPWVVFYLVPSALCIRTLVNFRIGIVMLVEIEPSSAWHGTQPHSWTRAT